MDKSQISLAIKEEIQRNILGQLDEMYSWKDIGGTVVKSAGIGAAVAAGVGSIDILSRGKVPTTDAHVAALAVGGIAGATIGVGSAIGMIVSNIKEKKQIENAVKYLLVTTNDKIIKSVLSLFLTTSKLSVLSNSAKMIKNHIDKINVSPEYQKDVNVLLMYLIQVLKESEHYDGELLNEDFGLTLGLTAGGLGLLYGWMRSKLINFTKDNVFRRFMQENDKTFIIEKRIPTIMKKFKLVSTLTDLHNIEKEISDIKKDIKALSLKVDEFVDKNYDTNFAVIAKVIISNPEKEKIRLKSFLSEFFKVAEESFDKAVQEKTDELLG